MKALISPELRRNVWLEFTPMRLLLMPTVLCLVFYLAFVLPGDHDALAPVAAALFALITVLWGASLAVTNLAEESVQRTWDWQRMSSITPLEITIGKLIGGPCYAWYGGLLCLAVLVVAGLMTGFGRIGYAVGMLVGIALLVHAAALLCTALALGKYGPMGIARLRSIVLLFGIMALFILAQLIDLRWALGTVPEIAWYGRPFRADTFSLISVYVFAAWAWLGAYHVFRGELGFRNAPWAFITFVVFLMTYLAGFVDHFTLPWAASRPDLPDLTWAARLMIAGLIGGLLTLGGLLQEKHDPVAYRRLLSGGRLPAHLIPRWSICLALTTLLAGAWVFSYGLLNPMTGVVLAAWLFLVRDVAVIVALNLRDTAKSADGLVLVYLIVAYVLLPSLPGGSNLFAPRFSSSLAALVPPAMQAVLAVAVLILKWRWFVSRRAVPS